MLDFADLLGAETERLAALVVSAEPSAPVPSCPEWTVRDLVTHVGRGHRWATKLVATRATGPLPMEKSLAPNGPAAWPAWLDDGAQALVSAVTEAGADCHVWAWRSDQTAGFWVRRMLHDELIHRADAQLALGQPADISAGVSAELAVDGVDDWLETVAALSASGGWHPELSKLVGTGQTLRLHATDTTGTWRSWASGPSSTNGSPTAISDGRRRKVLWTTGCAAAGRRKRPASVGDPAVCLGRERIARSSSWLCRSPIAA